MANFIEQLKSYWPFILFVGSLVIWSANIKGDITALQVAQAQDRDSINKLTDKLDKIDKMSIDVAIIRTDVDYLKKNR